LLDDYDGTNEALIPIASFLLQPATSLSFHMYFHTIFIRPAPMYVLAEFLSTNFFAHQFWLSPHRDILWALLRFQDPSASSFTVIGLHITTNRSSNHFMSRLRHGTLHQSLRAVRNQFIMNPKATSQEQSSFVPISFDLSSSASPIEFVAAHPDKMWPYPTSTLTLNE